VLVPLGAFAIVIGGASLGRLYSLSCPAVEATAIDDGDVKGSARAVAIASRIRLIWSCMAL